MFLVKSKSFGEPVFTFEVSTLEIANEKLVEDILYNFDSSSCEDLEEFFEYFEELSITKR